jgi:hypothetical protein
MSKYKACKFHQEYKCPWCRKWRKTFNYFRKRNCSELRLYCVELTHYRTGECFYKVGLTSGTVAKRFDEDQERFSLIELNEKLLPIYEAVTKETNLLFKLHNEGRLYRPKARISGYSECFR